MLFDTCADICGVIVRRVIETDYVMANKKGIDSVSVVEIQKQRWATGDRISVEALVAEHADVASESDVIMDLIYGEVLLREGVGEEPDPNDYYRRFPALKSPIARQFQVHHALRIPEFVELQETAEGGATINDQDTNVRVPPTIPGFELHEVVGRGGSGTVYRARDTKLNRVVAIKLLISAVSIDESQRVGLLREAEASAQLRHPGVVDVHQVGQVNESPFLVMEFLEGGALSSRLRTGPLPANEAVDLVQQVALAIHHAHSHGIIHRDVKPGNILLSAAGHPQVCDFGLARRLDSEHSLHATGDVIGTPAYMSPEQAQGKTADERSDVYAIGAVLYETLCGRSPFQAATPWEILNQVMTNDPAPLRQLNSSLPQDLETICQRCLEKDPNRRYASALEVSDELNRFQNGKPILARPVGQLQQIVKWCGRNRGIAALTATSMILLLVLGIGSTVAAFQLSSANASIRDEQKKTKTAEERAVQDRTAAIEALNRLVGSLYIDLSTNSATIKTRQKVLDAAIDGLQSITQIEGDREADRTAIIAHRKLGELMVWKGLTAGVEELSKSPQSITRNVEAKTE